MLHKEFFKRELAMSHGDLVVVGHSQQSPQVTNKYQENSEKQYPFNIAVKLLKCNKKNSLYL